VIQARNLLRIRPKSIRPKRPEGQEFTSCYGREENAQNL
jgi:hypothetical protein